MIYEWPGALFCLWRNHEEAVTPLWDWSSRAFDKVEKLVHRSFTHSLPAMIANVTKSSPRYHWKSLLDRKSRFCGEWSPSPHFDRCDLKAWGLFTNYAHLRPKTDESAASEAGRQPEKVYDASIHLRYLIFWQGTRLRGFYRGTAETSTKFARTSDSFFGC